MSHTSVQLPAKWVSLARAQFSEFEIGDAALGTKVHIFSKLPPAVRTAAAVIKTRGGKPVVYRNELATTAEDKNRVGYGVFDASDPARRVLVFGPNGEDLGKVRQRKPWENPWSQDQAEAFTHLPGQVNDDGSYADDMYRTHFGRYPG